MKNTQRRQTSPKATVTLILNRNVTWTGSTPKSNQFLPVTHHAISNNFIKNCRRLFELFC